MSEPEPRVLDYAGPRPAARLTRRDAAGLFIALVLVGLVVLLFIGLVT